MDTNTPQHPDNKPALADPRYSVPQAPTEPDAPQAVQYPRDRVLDLIALLGLISISAVVFIIAGPVAFTTVTSVGMGLFASWRAGQRPRP
ncbi:hypothetical protein ACPXCP_41105 [Streptomyces sp. DT20]|uniref:hypothetical protein n=1 Tax=Streptomyces sp. DT20 TaxID=3416519 RepID=UPI003CECC4A2